MDRKKNEPPIAQAPTTLGEYFGQHVTGPEKGVASANRYPHSTRIIIPTFDNLFSHLYISKLLPPEEVKRFDGFRAENAEKWNPLILHFDHQNFERAREAVSIFISEVGLAISKQTETELPGHGGRAGLSEIDFGMRQGGAGYIAFSHPMQALSLLRAFAAHSYLLRDTHDSFVKAEKHPRDGVTETDMVKFRNAYANAALDGREDFKNHPDLVMALMPMRPYASLDDAAAISRLAAHQFHHHGWHYLNLDFIENEIARDMGIPAPHPGVDLH